MATKHFEEEIPIAVVYNPQTTDPLGPLSQRYEVPSGLLSKLRLLEGMDLVFILDDSTSMFAESNLRSFESERIREHVKVKRNATRWDEMFDRVYTMIDFVSHMAINSVQITFLNRNTLTYKYYRREYLTATDFVNVCYQTLIQEHAVRPNGSTPIMSALKRVMGNPDPQSIYLFTDGEPMDASTQAIASFIARRSSPESHPITLISCTDNDEEVAWMKEVDENARYVAEVDDYVTEKQEVVRAHGKVFPYTKGVWIICHLVAAMDPECLDRLDEPVPMSRPAFEKLLGRPLEESEYSRYIHYHPATRKNQSCTVC